jgi:hypothetical protein
LESQVVEEVFVQVAPLWSLRINGRVIRTTPEHPFYVQNRGWLAAKELQPGMALASHDGQWVVLEESTDPQEVATVYNFRVAHFHTYFVGSREWGFSVWAHNAICADQVVEQFRRAGITEINGVQVTRDHPVIQDLVTAYANSNQPAPAMARQVFTRHGIPETPEVRDVLRSLKETDYHQQVLNGQLRQGASLEQAQRIADAQLALHRESGELIAGLRAYVGRTQGEIVQYLQDGSAGLNAHYNPLGLRHDLSEVRNVTSEVSNISGNVRVFAGGRLYGESPLLVIAEDGTMWRGSIGSNLRNVGSANTIVGQLTQIQ